MSTDDTQTTDSTEVDPNASGGILAPVVPDFVRRNFALKFGIVLFIMALSVGLVGLAATEQVRNYTEQQVLSDYENAAAQEANICHSGSTETGYRRSSSPPTISGPVAIPTTLR
jgi:hypothetical protein